MPRFKDELFKDFMQFKQRWADGRIGRKMRPGPQQMRFPGPYRPPCPPSRPPIPDYDMFMRIPHNDMNFMRPPPPPPYMEQNVSQHFKQYYENTRQRHFKESGFPKEKNFPKRMDARERKIMKRNLLSEIKNNWDCKRKLHAILNQADNDVLNLCQIYNKSYISSGLPLSEYCQQFPDSLKLYQEMPDPDPKDKISHLYYDFFLLEFFTDLDDPMNVFEEYTRKFAPFKSGYKIIKNSQLNAMFGALRRCMECGCICRKRTKMSGHTPSTQFACLRCGRRFSNKGYYTTTAIIDDKNEDIRCVDCYSICQFLYNNHRNKNSKIYQCCSTQCGSMFEIPLKWEPVE